VERADEWVQAPLEQVRRERAGLLATQARLSYWRSLLHARIDQLDAGRGPAVPAERLMPMLGKWTQAAHVGRGQRLSAPVPDETLVTAMGEATLGEAVGLAAVRRAWAEVVDPDDAAALTAARDLLHSIEYGLSAERAEVHRRIDAVTSELIRRYRADPLAALDALPDPR